MSEFAAGDSGGAATISSEGGSPTATASPESSSSGTITETGQPAVESTPGPVPYDRFNEVNSKYTTVRWAEGLDQQRTQQQQQFFQWLDADPEGAFRYMEDYLTRQGALTQRQQQQVAPPAADQRPTPDIVVPETGQRFYSADAAERLAKWEAKQSTDPLNQRLQTIEASHAQNRAEASARHQLAEAATWPYYTEHQGDILREMERDHRLSHEGAYRRVVLPKVRQLERQAVLKEINQKSQASTVNPGSQTASAGIPASKLGFAAVFKREMAKRGGKI